MLGTLMGDHWSVTDEADEADAVIVNTCGFIGMPKKGIIPF